MPKKRAENFQKIRWQSAVFLLAENAVFLLTVYIHIVVKPSHLPFKPQFVIIIIVSTCLERSKKMPLGPNGALA